MQNIFLQAWHYQITSKDDTLSIFLNGNMIGTIQRNSIARWPVFFTVNDRLYEFNLVRRFPVVIEITDAVTREKNGLLKMAFHLFRHTVVHLEMNGQETLTWEADNFFSLSWKWKSGDRTWIEAVENLRTGKRKGIVAVPEYRKGAEMLIVCGFFLSLYKRSRNTLGIRGLKRKSLFGKSR